MSEQAHDHSGDRLGEEAPVESIDVEEITIRDFGIPHSSIVYRDDGIWHSVRTATQDVEFTGEDGAAVINRTLERHAERGDGTHTSGTVLVTGGVGGSVIESETSIVHTADGVRLILQPGVTFRYTGTEQAVLLAGSGLSLRFGKIEASAATYGIVDLGIRNASVEGQTLVGGGESLWLSDAENRIETGRGPAGSHVRIQQLDCGGKADRGITLTSAPDGGINAYSWEVAVVHPKETGILVGDDSSTDSVRNQTFYASVKGAGSDATHLVEFNDSRNGIFLETHTPATGGDWDIVIGKDVEDAFVLPLTGRDTIRVKRESVVATDFSKFDPLRHEVMELAFAPDSLRGYNEISVGTGETQLSDGAVVHDTGEAEGSWANLRKRLNFNFGRIRFDNPATLQTQVEMETNDDQRAWLLWGDLDGPGVGWHIEDDTLYGYAHDSRGHANSAVLEPLIEGFAPGSSWTLTAFYNPPTDVHFYVGDRMAGSIGRKLPSGSVHAHRVLSVDLTSRGAGSKRLRWSEWKNHQYPVDSLEEGQ